MDYYIGLMSGTSMDAVDAALISLRGEELTIHGYREIPYPAEILVELKKTVAPRARVTPRKIGRLHIAIGVAFADAAAKLTLDAGLSFTQIKAIGSHGQTIAHGPDDTPPFTLQLGDPSTIAYRTGIAAVADFRAMDIAAGGQGAPLVPLFHKACFGRPYETVIVVNIGGIANITILRPEPEAPVIAFDTGPGNTLLDSWYRLHREQSYDADGAWAASGAVDPSLLRGLLSDPYFKRLPPKSTGREYFNLEWLRRHQERSMHDGPPENTQATLLALTVGSIVAAIEQWGPDYGRVLVCGGGANNVELMTKLQRQLARPTTSTATEGLDPRAVEAVAFAWLAARRMERRSGNVPTVTGARDSVVLGGLYERGDRKSAMPLTAIKLHAGKPPMLPR